MNYTYVRHTKRHDIAYIYTEVLSFSFGTKRGDISLSKLRKVIKHIGDHCKYVLKYQLGNMEYTQLTSDIKLSQMLIQMHLDAKIAGRVA